MCSGSNNNFFSLNGHDRWSITKETVNNCKNYSKEEKMELIEFLDNNVVPCRLRGKENEKERNLFRKKSKKLQVVHVVASNCTRKEIQFTSKSNSSLLHHDKSQIFEKLCVMHGENHVGRDALKYILNVYNIYELRRIISTFLSNCEICYKKKKNINKPQIKPIITSNLIKNSN